MTQKRTTEELQGELQRTLQKLKEQRLQVSYKHIAKIENTSIQWANEKYRSVKSLVESLQEEEKLAKAKEVASSKDGKCISTKWVSRTSPLQWKCSNPTHEHFSLTLWQVSGLNRWCPQCHPKTAGRNFNPKGLALAHQVAQSHGGKCLSTEYKGTENKLEWQCSDPSHPTWFAYYGNVVGQGCWCRKCSRAKKDTNGGK